ncbi:hypothetical protein BKA80DRAFT_139667 [Phyllosticta citrichinensis]
MTSRASFDVSDSPSPPSNRTPSLHLGIPELGSATVPSDRATSVGHEIPGIGTPGPPSDREPSPRPKSPELGRSAPSYPCDPPAGHGPPAASEPPSKRKSPELEKWRQDAISMVANAKFPNSSLRCYDDGKTVVECNRAMLEDLLNKVTAETLKDLEFARDFLIFATKVLGMPGIKSLRRTVALLQKAGHGRARH